MTARGTNLRQNSLSSEKELFMYDRKQLEASSKPLLEPLPKHPSIPPFPDDIESETDMASWRTLFKKRKQWAEYAHSQAKVLATEIRDVDAAAKIVQRSVAVAFSNLDTHSATLGTRLGEMRGWATAILEARDEVLEKWDPAMKKLVRVPVLEEVRKYIGDEKTKGARKVATLADFFTYKEVQSAAQQCQVIVQKFEKDVSVMAAAIEDVILRSSGLKQEIEDSKARLAGNLEEELRILLDDIDLLVNKVRTDCEYVRGLQGPKSASAASKRAYASTADYLPGLTGVLQDMQRLLTRAVDHKNNICKASHGQFQHVAQIQSISAPINKQVSQLDATYGEEDNNFRLLASVLRLPNLYGSLLLECIRRREWSEKFSGSSQRLAEELALMKEDEEKRRRKWHRMTGSLLPFDVGDPAQVVRAELNTRGDVAGGLPKVTRDDIKAYVAVLKSAEGNEDTVKELTQALQDLDKPSQRLTKRLKGFKMGSVHEANLMSSSFLGGYDEEVKSLRAQKVTLTERVKGYESRIRKLEDLLHRNRTNSANGFNAKPATPQPLAPGAQGTGKDVQPSERPGQLHSRSSSDVTVTQDLMSQVAALKGELASERERSVQQMQEATEKNESERAMMNARISQADDTKRDLVANLDAMQQQHTTERKALQTDIDDLKVKLDEAYEDVDKLEEYRTDLEATQGELDKLKEEIESLRKMKDEEAASLRQEVERQTRRADEESQRAGEVEAALTNSEQSTARLVQNVGALERELKETKDALAAERLKHTQGQEGLVSSLVQAHNYLTTEPVPEDTDLLAEKIGVLVSSIVLRNEELSSSLEQLRQELDTAKTTQSVLLQRFDTRTIKAKDLTQRLYTHNARIIQLLESLGYRVIRGDGPMQIVKIPSRTTNNAASTTDSDLLASTSGLPDATTSKATPSPLSIAHSSSAAEDINLLYWMESADSDAETEKYSQYLKTIGSLDLDAFAETITARIRKGEQDCKQLMKHSRAYREKYYRARDDAAEKIAYKSFKPGDLALFLPTRNQAAKPWAAFNVGAPHYFLREVDNHKLASRDFLLARISKVEERVVDLSRSRVDLPPDRQSLNSEEGAPPSVDEDNPFALSDGLRWYLLDAVEEKPGAPTTPGLSTSTVATTNADVKASKPNAPSAARRVMSGARRKLAEITTGQERRASSGSGSASNRNSLAMTAEQVAAAMMASGAAESAVESVPGTPRTPVEKVLAFGGRRSRAGSFRSTTAPPPPSAGGLS